MFFNKETIYLVAKLQNKQNKRKHYNSINMRMALVQNNGIKPGKWVTNQKTTEIE